MDGVDISDSGLGGTDLSNTVVVGGVVLSFDAGKELEGLEEVGLVVLSTDFHEVVLAFSLTVLALEVPFTGAGCGLSGVTIWVEVDGSHIKEAFGLHGVLEVSGNLVSASWAL